MSQDIVYKLSNGFTVKFIKDTTVPIGKVCFDPVAINAKMKKNNIFVVSKKLNINEEDLTVYFYHNMPSYKSVVSVKSVVDTIINTYVFSTNEKTVESTIVNFLNKQDSYDWGYYNLNGLFEVTDNLVFKLSVDTKFLPMCKNLTLPGKSFSHNYKYANSSSYAVCSSADYAKTATHGQSSLTLCPWVSLGGLTFESNNCTKCMFYEEDVTNLYVANLKEKNTEETFSIFVTLIRNSNDNFIVKIFDDKNVTIHLLEYADVKFTKKQIELHSEVKDVFEKVLNTYRNNYEILITDLVSQHSLDNQKTKVSYISTLVFSNSKDALQLETV